MLRKLAVLLFGTITVTAFGQGQTLTNRSQLKGEQSATNSFHIPLYARQANPSQQHLSGPKGPTKSSSKRIKSQDMHSRVWETIQTTVDSSNQLVLRTNSFTELASGLNYRENGVWKPTSEQIDLTPDGGARAFHGPHCVTFAPNVNTEVAVDLKLPKGNHLKSHILGLGYYDFKANKTIIFAELKDSVGQLIASNKVLYADAFTEMQADVIYTYTKAGLEQDVVLRQQPPDPSLFGLNYETTRLQVYTEFLNPPEPTARQKVKWGWKKALVDVSLDFGAMKIGRGKAFLFGDNSGRDKGVDVEKHWREIDGRTFLVEETALRSLTAHLSMLPKPSPPQNSPGGPSTPNSSGKKNASNQAPVRQASAKLKLPAPKAERERTGSITVASLPPSQKGLVLDYLILNSDTDFVFRGDITYYVPADSELYIDGTTTIEGGTVVKYDRNSKVVITGSTQCNTDMYHPAIFTAVDDDTYGEVLYDYTSSTVSGLYADTALEFCESANLHDLHVYYATQAISFQSPTYGSSSPYDYTLQHSQIANCQTALSFSYTSFDLGNVLLYSLTTVIGGQHYQGLAEHLTIDQYSLLTSDDDFHFDDDCGSGPSSWIDIDNSLIVGLGDYGVVPLNFDSGNVQFIGFSTGVFQSSSNGFHYLPSDSSYRGVGTSSVSSSLLADLKKRTTQAPIDVPLFTDIKGSLTFGPQIPRDTNSSPDLGYHYDALDFTVNCVVADEGSSINVLPGTAIAVRNDPDPSSPTLSMYQGFILTAGSSFNAKGFPTNPIVFSDLHLVQEGPFRINAIAMFIPDWMPMGMDFGDGIKYNEQGLAPPSLNLRFANFYCGSKGFTVWAGTPTWYYWWLGSASLRASLYWDMQDCAIHDGFIVMGTPDMDFSIDPFPPAVVSWKNNLFDQAKIELAPTYDTGYGVDFVFSAYNNFFRGGLFDIQPTISSQGNWVLMDNLFDRVAYIQDASRPLDYDYNAYFPLDPGVAYPYDVALQTTTTGDSVVDGTHDVTLSSVLPYQSGPFGNYYLPDMGYAYGSSSTIPSPLYGTGSRTPADAGLYHYTTNPSQTKEGAASSGHKVNIGLHYVATTGSSTQVPIDSDSDGIPDYVENWHGDGIYANHTDTETDWNNAHTVTLIADSVNAIYDDRDLSGNGLAGRFKKLLGMNAFDTSNPFLLQQTTTGDEPTIATFNIPINYGVLTNAGSLNLNINGMDVVNEGFTSNAVTTNATLVWNTAYDSPGPHLLQAQYTLDIGGGNGTVIQTFGPLLPFYSDNVVQFSEGSAMFDSSGAFLDATLPVPNASYVIHLYDPSTSPRAHLTDISGSTTTGVIQEECTIPSALGGGQEMEADFEVSLLDSDGITEIAHQTQTEKLTKLVTSESGNNFDVVYFYTPLNNDMLTIFNYDVWTGMQSVVDVLTQPSWPWDVYDSYFNSFSGGFISLGYPGYVTSKSTIDNVLIPDMTSGLTKNFYAYGHGNDGVIGEKSGPVALLAPVLGPLLGNEYDKNTKNFHVKNPYRFVFMDGCRTASGNRWRRAFGILPIWAPRAKIGPQAYVGWDQDIPSYLSGLYDVPSGTFNYFGSEGQANGYTDTLTLFYLDWMNGCSVAQCIKNASNPSLTAVPFGVPSNKTVTFTTSHGTYVVHNDGLTSRIFVVGHSGLTVTGLNAADDNYFVREDKSKE